MAKGIKTGGRQKGKPNKNSAVVKSRIGQFVNDNWDEFIKTLDSLKKTEPKFYCSMIGDLLEYTEPKLQRTELKAAEDNTKPLFTLQIEQK